MIVVTGATGKLGRLVLDALLQTVPAVQLAVAIRTPSKAAGGSAGLCRRRRSGEASAGALTYLAQAR